MPQMTEREARKLLGDLPVTRETAYERVAAMLLTVASILGAAALLLYLAWIFDFGPSWPETNYDGNLVSETADADKAQQ